MWSSGRGDRSGGVVAAAGVFVWHAASWHATSIARVARRRDASRLVSRASEWSATDVSEPVCISTCSLSRLAGGYSR